MPIEIDTTEYESSHGTRPRGRGSWAFIFDAGSREPWWAPCPLTFMASRQLARAEAKRRGATYVLVCP